MSIKTAVEAAVGTKRPYLVVRKALETARADFADLFKKHEQQCIKLKAHDKFREARVKY